MAVARVAVRLVGEEVAVQVAQEGGEALVHRATNPIPIDNGVVRQCKYCPN